MIVRTKFFGEIEVQQKDIIKFAEGILGFPDYLKYILVHPEGDVPFIYLQSIEDINTCFVVMQPIFILEDYEIDISKETVDKLHIEKPEDVEMYTILTIPEETKKMTANLKAPILVNRANNMAIQEILQDSQYEIRHKVIKEADASC